MDSGLVSIKFLKIPIPPNEQMLLFGFHATAHSWDLRKKRKRKPIPFNSLLFINSTFSVLIIFKKCGAVAKENVKTQRCIVLLGRE